MVGRKKSVRKRSDKEKILASLGLPAVPLWRRLFAYVIDMLIVGCVVILPMGAFYGDFGDVPDGDFGEVYSSMIEKQRENVGLQGFLKGFFMAVLIVLYWALLEYRFGQSVGKMLMKIRVESFVKVKGVRVGKAGLSFNQCFFRNVTKVATIILFFDVLYGVFKRSGRRYFEVLSNTNVVWEK